jgi:hypothetical protein
MILYQRICLFPCAEWCITFKGLPKHWNLKNWFIGYFNHFVHERMYTYITSTYKFGILFIMNRILLKHCKADNIVLKIPQLHIYSENITFYLFAEYAYVWHLQTLLLVKCCIFTPFHIYKQDVKLHFDYLSGKLFPNAKYGAAIYWMQ